MLFRSIQSAVVQHPNGTLDKAMLARYVMDNLRNPRQNQMLSGCWAKLYHHNLIGRFPDLTTAEDLAFNFDCLRICKSVRFISDIVYHNRKRSGSLSTTFDEKDKTGLFGVLEALHYVKRFLKPFYTELEIEDALNNSKTYHSMLYFTRIMKQTGESPRDTLMRLYP